MAASPGKNSRCIDILVNNAGIAHVAASVEDLPLAVWREVIETNLTGTFLLTQAVLPLMKPGSTMGSA